MCDKQTSKTAVAEMKMRTNTAGSLLLVVGILVHAAAFPLTVTFPLSQTLRHGHMARPELTSPDQTKHGTMRGHCSV